MEKTERDRVMSRSEMCDLGELLVSKALADTAKGRLIEHLDRCRRCAEATA